MLETINEIHIDYIIQLATTKTEEVKLRYYTNLQPLLAKDNLNKGRKHKKIVSRYYEGQC